MTLLAWDCFCYCCYSSSPLPKPLTCFQFPHFHTNPSDEPQSFPPVSRCPSLLFSFCCLVLLVSALLCENDNRQSKRWNIFCCPCLLRLNVQPLFSSPPCHLRHLAQKQRFPWIPRFDINCSPSRRTLPSSKSMPTQCVSSNNNLRRPL